MKAGSTPKTEHSVVPFVSVESTIELLTPKQRSLENPSRRLISPPPTESQATRTH